MSGEKRIEDTIKKHETKENVNEILYDIKTRLRIYFVMGLFVGTAGGFIISQIFMKFF